MGGTLLHTAVQGKSTKITISSFHRSTGGTAGIFYLFLCCCTSVACLQTKHIWVKPRNRKFKDDIAGHWSDKEWKQNFHLNKATFRFLCQELQPYLEGVTLWDDHRPWAKSCHMPVEARAIVECRTISHLFEVRLPTVHMCVRAMFAVLLWSSLLPNTLRFQQDKVFSRLWMAFCQCGAFLSDSAPLMVATFRSLLPKKTLWTVSTGKATILSYCRRWWTMNASFWTSVWAGQAVSMMYGCWPT